MRPCKGGLAQLKDYRKDFWRKFHLNASSSAFPWHLSKGIARSINSIKVCKMELNNCFNGNFSNVCPSAYYSVLHIRVSCT